MKMKIKLLLLIFVFLSSIMILPKNVNATYTKIFSVLQSSDDCTKYSTNLFTTTRTSITAGILASITYNDNGIRFENVSIEPAEWVYLKSAKIYIRGNGYSGSENAIWYRQQDYNPSTFTNLTDFNSRNKTTYYYFNTIQPVFNQWKNQIIYGLFNEWIYDYSTWHYNDSIVLFFTHYIGSGYKSIQTYDLNPLYAPYIEFTFFSTYYCTFYNNNDNAFYMELYNFGSILNNGTEFQFIDYEDNFLFFITALNGSYIFKYYTSSFGDNSTDNPYSWAIYDSCGNLTIWAYSEPNSMISQSQSESFTIIFSILIATASVLISFVIFKKK